MVSFSISGNIVDIINREVFPGTVTVIDSKVKAVEKEIGKEYDKYIMPGFIDAHIHIESSMLVPSEFARLAVTHGTVAAVSDPHEIANVLGVDGIKFMIENASKVPFKFYFGASSCVPATSFETSGAEISSHDIEMLFRDFRLKYLSEMMNYPGVLNEFPDVMNKLMIARKYNKPIDGHAPGLMGDDARKYISAGISTDHECYTLEEAINKIFYGMKILIREGSAAKNFDSLKKLIEARPEMIMFCSDDKHPDDLVEGHINDVVKRAIAEGYDLMKVLRSAILNPIEHYKLDVGLLREGDLADFIVVKDLKGFDVMQVYLNGKLSYDNGQSLIKSVEVQPINKFNASKKVTADFEVEAVGRNIRVIEALDGELITKEIICDAKIDKGNIISDTDNDILKLTVVNRYNDVKPAVAFVKNFGLKRGAIASSVGHDSHNIIAVGTTDDDLCRAVNAVISYKGGMSVVDGAEVIELALPVAGLMSADNGYEVAKKYSELDAKAKELGSKLNAPFMTLSFMALLVIPEIKLSDKGLFNGKEFKFIDLQIS